MCTGLGKIKTRDNAALWGTEQECKLRQPDDPFYKKFAAECSRVQIAVDVFAMGCAHPLVPEAYTRQGLRCDGAQITWRPHSSSE